MFRFSIRDVLWITLAAALAVGWWKEHSQIDKQVGAKTADLRRAIREQEDAKVELQAAKAKYEKGYEDLDKSISFGVWSVPAKLPDTP